MYQIPDQANVTIIGNVMKDLVQIDVAENPFWLFRVLTNPFFDAQAPKDIQNRSRFAVGVKITKPQLGSSALELIKKGGRILLKGVMGTRRTPMMGPDGPLVVNVDGRDHHIERAEPLVYLENFIPVTGRSNNKDKFDIEAVGNIVNDPILIEKERRILYARFISNPFRRKYDQQGVEIPIEKQNMLRNWFGVKATAGHLINDMLDEIKKGTRIRLTGRIGARRTLYTVPDKEGNLIQVVGQNAEGNKVNIEKTEPVIYAESFTVISLSNKGILEQHMTQKDEEPLVLEEEE